MALSYAEIRKRDKRILDLYLVDKVSAWQIAKLFNLTPARIHQIIKNGKS